MPDAKYHVVVVDKFGPARCLSFAFFDETLAALREQFPKAEQIFVFHGGKRLPTTKPPVCLKDGDKLHPLYETPVEPDVDDAGFLSASAGEDYEVAEKKEEAAAPAFDDDPDDPFEDVAGPEGDADGAF